MNDGNRIKPKRAREDQSGKRDDQRKMKKMPGSFTWWKQPFHMFCTRILMNMHPYKMIHAQKLVNHSQVYRYSNFKKFICKKVGIYISYLLGSQLYQGVYLVATTFFFGIRNFFLNIMAKNFSSKCSSLWPQMWVLALVSATVHLSSTRLILVMSRIVQGVR